LPGATLVHHSVGEDYTGQRTLTLRSQCF